jgi:hypothetical protein
MNLQSVWSILTEADEPLDEYPMTAMMNVAAELDLPPDWFTWVAAGYLFGEEAITTEKYMRLFPYGLAKTNDGRFASAVQEGYLTVNDIVEYRPSDSGLEVLKKISRALDASVDHLDPMPKEGVQKLVDYLTRLEGASFLMPEPPAKWLISYKRRNMRPVEGSCLLRYVIYYYDQIAAYRDDMYVATWKAHGVEGHAWEMLDYLSQSDALTFDELHTKLSRRGVTEEVHAGDVREFVGRGWAEEGSGAVQITLAGKQVRAEVEAETERLFFAPWLCLNESELDESSSLAGQLRGGLKAE